MTNEVKNEIDEMLKSLDSIEEPVIEPEPEPEPEPVSEDVKPPEEEKVEEKTDSEDKSEDVKLEEKVEEPPTEVKDDKDKTIEELRAKLADVAVKAEPKKEEPKETPIPDQDFVKDLDLDDLGRDPAEFNKLLNVIYKQAVSDARKGVMTELPSVVRDTIALTQSLREMHDKFYDDNKDLIPFKKVVATVFDELVAEDPNQEYNKVMERVAPEVRKRLELPEQVANADTKKEDKPSNDKPPALPRKGSSAGKSTNEQPVNKLQSELEAMNKALQA